MNRNLPAREVSRRAFMKWTATGVGGAALAASLPFSLRGITPAEAAEITEYVGGTWTKSGCNMCGGQCSIDVYVENGIVRKIEPPGGATGQVVNPGSVANVSDNYTAAVNGGDIGRLCSKGNAGIKSLYDPERIQTPLRRVGPRGSGQFEPITWDEAIEEVAMKLQTIRATYGARSLTWFAEDHSFNHPQTDFCKAFGTPNFSNHSNICDTSRKSHYLSTLGHDRPLADMENADVLFVWGWNFLSALKWIHLAPIFARARMNNPNFKFIYVDPVFNTTASKADTWVPVRPGTDGALALALCKHLIDANAVDMTFVNAYTLGYGEFVKYLAADATGVYNYATDAPWAGTTVLAWAAGITGLTQAAITAIGAQLVTAKSANQKICIDAWSGPGHHTNATQGGRAIDCLLLLLGAVDGRGQLGFPLRNGPPQRSSSWGAQYNFGWPSANGWRVDGRDDVTIPATYTYPDGTVVSNPANGAIKRNLAYPHGSGNYVAMRQRMIEQKDFVGNPYPIKACMIVFQNLMMSIPNPTKTERALNEMEFVCVVDTHLSETALMADIVIPGSHYLERNDFNASWSLFRSVGLRRRVVDSWFGGMAEPNFFLQLGAAMGFNGFMTAPENATDDAYNEDEWNKFMAYGTGNATTPSPWNNQMTWSQLKTAGVWVETLTAPTTGAASTPKGGSHFHKFKATKSLATTDNESSLTVGAQTVHWTVSSTGTKLGIGTGARPATYEVGFATSSRRAQFWDPLFAEYYSGTRLFGDVGGNRSMANDKRFYPLPFYLPPEDAPATPGSGTWPFYFISWKEVEHTHTRTFNNEWLMELKRENRLLMHPTAAATVGVENGDFVWVQSPHGIIKVRAQITHGIQAETVGFVRGFGHWALGKLAKNKGAHDGWLLPGKYEIHSGQAVHKEVACRVYKEA